MSNRKINSGNDEFWYPEEIVKYIIVFLKRRFPNSIINQQSGKADIVVLRDTNSIPVEIQKTLTRGNKNGVRIAYFEDSCRRQIEQNIEISGICYLFLDAKFLEYLNKISYTDVSLNMMWLYEYHKEEKVKIFSITRNGIIKSLEEEDLRILTKFVVTDLDKNRYTIEYNVLKWKDYTTDEINGYYEFFKENDTEYKDFDWWLFREGSTIREKELGSIYVAIANLNCINRILNCSQKNIVSQCLSHCRSIGLFNKDGGNGLGKFARTYFVDDANVAKYFEGYNKNKDLWEYIRSHPIHISIIYRIIKGEYPNFLKDRKCQKSILEAF